MSNRTMSKYIDPWENLETDNPLLLPVREPGGGSEVENLLNAVEAHVHAEADSLTSYRQLADSAADPVVALLMRLVLKDEERHHRLMARIAVTLEDSLRWRHSANALPTSPGPTGAPTGQTIAAVREFIAQEHEGARQMRELARQSGPLNDGLNALLLETMAMDSEKHERVLRFVLRLLQEGR